MAGSRPGMEPDPIADVNELIDAHAGEVTLRVTDLLYVFGQFNLNARDTLAQQLTSAGIEVDPPLADVERSSMVRLRHVDHASTAREPEITHWVLGRDGEVRALEPGTEPDGVLWIDIEAEGVDARHLDPVIDKVLELVHPSIADEDASRLAKELERHEHRPATHRYGPNVGSLSTFVVVHDEETPEDPSDPTGPKTGRLTFWPLEIAAGDRFVVTIRRAGERISARTRAHSLDNQGQVQRCPVLAAHEVENQMRHRWHAASTFDGDRTGGDAALLLLHWVGDGALKALMEIEAWLRQWELHVLEHEGTPEKITLITLRDMLSEMETRLSFFAHPHAEDPVNGWVPAVTEADEAQQLLSIMRRVVRIIDQLQTRVRDRLMAVAHIGDEKRGDRMEFAGFLLLFPALILGIFSTNARTPGKDEWWGFALVIAAMCGLTYGAYRFVRRR